MHDGVAALIERTRACRLPSPVVRRELRQRAGLTLADVAEAIGVTPTSVLRWEAGSRPSADHAIAYRELLDALEAATR